MHNHVLCFIVSKHLIKIMGVGLSPDKYFLTDHLYTQNNCQIACMQLDDILQKLQKVLKYNLTLHSYDLTCFSKFYSNGELYFKTQKHQFY